MSLTLNEFITRLQALIVEAGSTPASPPVAPPVGPVNPPSVPSLPPAPPGFVKGPHIYQDFNFLGFFVDKALCNAQKNFNWLMNNYGSSYAYIYMVKSAVLSNYFIWEWEAQRGERATANYIINLFMGAGKPPAPLVIYSGGYVSGSTLVYHGVTVSLPFQDNLLYS
jgi:hypothetical protein